MIFKRMLNNCKMVTHLLKGC